MMIKYKLVTGLLLGMSILGLAGCGAQKNATNNSSSKKSSSSVQSSSESTSSSSQQSTSSSQTSTSSSSSTTTSDTSGPNLSNKTKTVGVLVALLAKPNWFKSNVNNGSMYFQAQDPNASGNIKEYNYITSNGDQKNYIYYQINGNNVTYRQMINDDGDFDTHTVSIDRLVNDYYVNQGQKNEVNGYVNGLKPESSYNN